MLHKNISPLPILLAGVLVFFSPVSLYAANFFVTQDSGAKKTGDTIRATLYIDTTGANINNAEAVVSFPQNLVQVQSLSTFGSIFSLWIEQPSFSNQNGTITFSGGVPNPGFTGSRGKVIEITFKALAVGDAPVTISSASILANDGLGTDVTSPPSNTVIAIQEKTPPPVPEAPQPTNDESPSTSTVPAPRITSREIANPAEWYNIKDATFSWRLPSGVTKVLTSLDSNPQGIPAKEYTPPISSRKITSLDEGKQYLHVRFIGKGSQSDIATYPINIDTTAPDEIALSHTTLPSGGTTLTFSSRDNLSGLSAYVLQIDGVTTAKITGGLDTAITHMLPVMQAGEHTIAVKAYDKAGNSAQKSITITTQLLPPTITEHPRSIANGDPVTISGISPYASSTVRIWVKEDNGKAISYITTTDQDGAFTYTLSTLQAQKNVDMYAEMLVSTTEKSTPSNDVSISVDQSSTSVIIVLLVAVIILGALYILYMRIQLWKLRLEKNLDLTSVDIDDELESISTGIKNYIKVLRLATKRQTMSHAEEVELRALFKQLAKAHSVLTKKLGKGVRK